MGVSQVPSPTGTNIEGLLTAKGAMFAASATGVASETHQQSEAQTPISAPNDPNGMIWGSPLITKRLFTWYANPGAATFTTVGAPAGPTVSTTASNTDDAEGPWVNFATATTANTSFSGLIPAAYTYVRSGWVPDCEIFMKTAASIATMKIILGMTSASPDAMPTPTTLHGAWFRYDTSVDGTAFWRTCTGAGAAPTVTTTGQAIAANTTYKLRIEFVGTKGVDPTSIRFLINDSVVATHTTTLPLANQTFSPTTRITTTAASAAQIKIGKVAVAAF